MGNLDHEAEIGLDHVRARLLVALLDARRQADLVLGGQQSNLPDLAQIDLDPILPFLIAVDHHRPLTLPKKRLSVFVRTETMRSLCVTQELSNWIRDLIDHLNVRCSKSMFGSKQ